MCWFVKQEAECLPLASVPTGMKPATLVPGQGRHLLCDPGPATSLSHFPLLYNVNNNNHLVCHMTGHVTSDQSTKLSGFCFLVCEGS